MVLIAESEDRAGPSPQCSGVAHRAGGVAAALVAGRQALDVGGPVAALAARAGAGLGASRPRLT